MEYIKLKDHTPKLQKYRVVFEFVSSLPINQAYRQVKEEIEENYGDLMSNLEVYRIVESESKDI